MLNAIETLQLSPGEAIVIETFDQSLYIQRQSQQWLIARTELEHPCCWLEKTLQIRRQVSIPAHAEKLLHWSSGEQASTLRIAPCMADKNLVVRPQQALVIPEGCKPTFYINLPLMYQLYIGNSKKPVYEFFIEQLPLTWFGSNTRRGELCYEINSSVSQEQNQLTPPHQAVLELRLANKDSEYLYVDKINLPAQYLPVYRVDGHAYWTTALTITNEKLTNDMSLHYGKSVPCRYDQLMLINESRLRSEARTILRALEAIIG